MGEKKRQRTAYYYQKQAEEVVQSKVKQAIEDYHFKQLVGRGIIVPEPAAKGTCANQPAGADNSPQTGAEKEL